MSFHQRPRTVRSTQDFRENVGYYQDSPMFLHERPRIARSTQDFRGNLGDYQGPRMQFDDHPKTASTSQFFKENLSHFRGRPVHGPLPNVNRPTPGPRMPFNGRNGAAPINPYIRGNHWDYQNRPTDGPFPNEDMARFSMPFGQGPRASQSSPHIRSRTLHGMPYHGEGAVKKRVDKSSNPESRGRAKVADYDSLLKIGILMAQQPISEIPFPAMLRFPEIMRRKRVEPQRKFVLWSLTFKDEPPNEEPVMEPNRSDLNQQCEPWVEGLQRKELRRPKQNPTLETNIAGNSSGPSSAPNSQTFKPKGLSADAAEFFPKSYKHNEPAVPLGIEDGGISMDAADILKECMAQLTTNPEKFDLLNDSVMGAFHMCPDNGQAEKFLINTLIEQAVMQTNFRYTGVRICALVAQSQSQYLDHINARCSKDHEARVELLKTDCTRLRGIVLFLAEAFAQLLTPRGHRINTLGKQLCDTLVTLLTVPTDDNIKCVCQVMKLIGQALDQDHPTSMFGIFENLVELSKKENLGRNIAPLIGSVISLRDDHWGQITQTLSSANHPAEQTPLLCMEDDYGAVCYGPDGHILSDEERSFLEQSFKEQDDTDFQYNVDAEFYTPDDELGEDFDSAYEDFLKLSIQNRST